MNLDDAWWEQYEAWAEETSEVHVNLARAAKGLLGVEADHGLNAIIDLGCGRLCLAERWWSPYRYVGIDVAKIEGTTQADWNNIDWQAYRDTLPGKMVVTALYSVELYDPNPEQVYTYAFNAGVDAIISAGVRYQGTPEHELIGELGSTIRQTSTDLSITSWNEARIITPVPSTMFGEDVLEVWRVMTPSGRA